MMKCFSIFHSKAKDQKSPPSKSTQRVVKSTAGPVSSPRRIPEIYKEKQPNLKKFSFLELRNATSNFNKLLKIGEGGFGSVYKARIRLCETQSEPIVIAIKRLNKNGMQGHKEWLTEVQFLGVVDHPNLVKLLGYCSVDGERMQRLLVYEYMPNKSLSVHLFSTSLPPIPWKTRLCILLGAAEGLAYLHEGLEIQVIFRDFKSSNVLLDEKFNAKLSDFGLAREGPEGDRTHVSTKPVGTYGYAAPEYTETGHLKSKSDVWSFGVVVFEILTGKRAVDRTLPQTEQKLIHWVKQFPADSRNFWMMMDRRLNKEYSLDAARNIAKLAFSCLCKNPDDRPTMSQVVVGLRDAIRVSEPIRMSSGSSRELSPDCLRSSDPTTKATSILFTVSSSDDDDDLLPIRSVINTKPQPKKEEQADDDDDVNQEPEIDDHPNLLQTDTNKPQTGPYLSSSTLPLLLPDKIQCSKALVEFEGESIDLSGDLGVVGRVVISDSPSGDQDMLLDLKGTIYKTTIIPSRTFCVVSFGQSEAKIEAIMNDFIQLKPQSNVYEAETMVEGTLEGFSFDSEDEADKQTVPQADETEGAEPQTNGKGRRKAEKTSEAAKKKGKAAVKKPAKKVKRKTPVAKKTKAKK